MSAQLAQALRNLMKAYPTSSSLAQTDAHIAAQAALAGFEAAPQQEPDCWAILTPNGSRLVSPDEAKGRKGAYPLFAAPQQEPAITVTIDEFDLVQDWAESRLPPGTHKLYAAPQQEPSQASTYEPDPAHDNRYRVEQQGFWWWVIRAGDGTRTLFKAHTKISAMELAQELATAFRDGEFVGQSEKAQQAQAPGWQDIATAPKDGSLLLLFERYEDEPFIGSWQYGKWTASRTHYDTDGNACVTDRVYSDGVSHWMPLPAAPQQGSNT